LDCPACRRALGPVLYAAVPDYEQGVDAVADFAECPNCGTLAQVPARTAAELRRFYPPDYRAHVSGAARPRSLLSFLKNFQARSILRRIEAHLPSIKHNPKIVELGCGSGHLLMALREKGYSRLLGVDSEASLSKNFEKTGIRFIAGDVEKGLLLDDSYDVILLMFSIEHFADPQKALAWCRGLLAPGGKVILLTPDANGLTRRVFSRYWSGLHSPRHAHIFTGLGMSLLARNAGFASVETIPAADPGSWAVSFQNWIGRPANGSLGWYTCALMPLWWTAALIEKALGRASSFINVLSA
jgi:ubiquinone/menaquinone biosynthesis C-methylase UbiE